ncbi:response regulator [Longimicrobium sp.]|uniref:ATP-binding response regulator n=1 Tax=Longimicrobium sp. TaxID=2029185 RepID=UPI002E2F1B23|nr:response regulator [Longimicrobium sp.]HEX6038000.1 response regulator [Longimicrobium sp.]
MTAPADDAPLLLVVDDEPSNVDVLRDLLEALGYRTLGAGSGDAALALARDRRPDLVLLDVMMPGMDGLEACRRLKADAATASIPVVFVTALSDARDRARALDAGGDDFLTKPFSRPVLVARIRSLLRLKAAQDQLADSYRRLRELEALKDDLTRMVVHDLKAPLTGILGSLEIVLDGDAGPLSADQRRLLGDAQERGGDLLRMVDNLLDLSRLEESAVQLSPRDLDAARLLREVAGAWSVRAEREGARVAVEAPAGLSVRADEGMVRRVLGNLIGNALRHGGAGVSVRLSAVPAEGDGVKFTVADNGPGIAEADHEFIFRKYGRRSTDSVGDLVEGAAEGVGSGLGLTFCKLAVEAHGGRIWVQSRPGEGAAFHFVLPPRPQGD